MPALSVLCRLRAVAVVVGVLTVGSGVAAGLVPADTDEPNVLVDPPVEFFFPDVLRDLDDGAATDEEQLPRVVVATASWKGCASAGVALSDATVALVPHDVPTACDEWSLDAGRFSPLLVDGLVEADLLPAPADGLTILRPGLLEFGPVRLVDDGAEVSAHLELTAHGWVITPKGPIRHGAAVVQDGHLVGFFDRSVAPIRSSA